MLLFWRNIFCWCQLSPKKSKCHIACPDTLASENVHNGREYAARECQKLWMPGRICKKGECIELERYIFTNTNTHTRMYKYKYADSWTHCGGECSECLEWEHARLADALACLAICLPQPLLPSSTKVTHFPGFHHIQVCCYHSRGVEKMDILTRPMELYWPSRQLPKTGKQEWIEFW